MMGICQHSLYAGFATSLLVLNGASLSAGLMVTTTSAPIQIGFDDYRGDGLAPNPSSRQLDSDAWRITGLSDGMGQFGGTHTTGDFARGPSSGGVTTGGIYGFNVGTESGADWALGFQPTGSDLTAGAVTLMLTNATGRIVNQVDLAYQVLARNDGDRSGLFQFAYSSDDISYQSIDTLQVLSDPAADANPQWVATDRVAQLSGLNLVDGSALFLQWRLDDWSGSGGRDEWALNQIDVTFESEVSTVPEPPSWVLLGMAFPALIWSRRKRKRLGGIDSVSR